MPITRKDVVTAEPKPIRAVQTSMIPIDKMTEILCCPDCRGDLELISAPLGLRCLSCKEAFSPSDGIFEMFRQADLLDRGFAHYREAYEEHAKRDLFSSPADVTQWSWLEVLKSFMGKSAGGLVLDIGSADGKLGALISEQVICFDISLTYLKSARDKALTAVAGKAEALPFKRVFERIVLSNILEHVPKPEAIMAQVQSVLKPSGTLFIIVPYKEDLSWYEDEGVLDPHLSSFDLPRIRNLLRGFRITRHKFILFTDSRPLYFVKSTVKKFSPGLYRSLRRIRKTLGQEKGKGEFPKWKNALNYVPNFIVLPFMRPYLILIEAKKTE